MQIPIGTQQMWEQMAKVKEMAALPTTVQADIELMRKHLRDYRDGKIIKSAAVDAEIKRLIGE